MTNFATFIADVVAAYRSQAEVESGFRQLKDPHVVSFSPMHHWTDQKIRVHVDLDVQKFFISVDHDLMVKAVEANTDQKWVVLYVKRWLTAPMRMPDGTVVERDVEPAGRFMFS